MPVVVPSGVDIKIDGQTVSVKGPKGQLTRTFHDNMKIEREDGKIAVQRPDDSQENRALHGLTRTLIANMVTGVTTGFAKDLEISGTGYRAIPGASPGSGSAPMGSGCRCFTRPPPCRR